MSIYCKITYPSGQTGNGELVVRKSEGKTLGYIDNLVLNLAAVEKICVAAEVTNYAVISFEKADDEDGRGYSGGHNTAARLGWDTYHKQPQKDADAWKFLENSGTWTGYQPYTRSYFGIKAEPYYG